MIKLQLSRPHLTQITLSQQQLKSIFKRFSEQTLLIIVIIVTMRCKIVNWMRGNDGTDKTLNFIVQSSILVSNLNG